MRLVRKYPILASLALHALLALAFLRQWAGTEPTSSPEAVIVDLEPQPEGPEPLTSRKPPSQGRASSASHGGKFSHPTNDISGLGLSSLRPTGPSPLTNPLRPGEYAPEQDGFSAYSGSEGAFAAKDIAAFGAYNWAHQKIQLGLGYPGEFIRNGIEGRAQARFRFDSDGRLDATSLHVKADSPYLRVYVHRLIEHTFLRQRVPAHMRKWKEHLEVVALVQFSLVESRAAVALGMPTPIVGNRLFFARKSDGKTTADKLRWRVGPLHGLFPVPAVGVDVLWFAERAKELGQQKHPVDELAPWREDPLFSQGS